MLKVIESKKYAKNLKNLRHKKKVLAELREVIRILINQEPVPSKYKDHELKGKFNGVRELHLVYDDLLLYFVRNEQNQLVLFDIGTHSRTLGI